MSAQDRVKMVKAMEYIARHINDENVFEGWLMDGVADGDIAYGDLSETPTDCVEYTEDDNFADLMDAFLWCMQRAYESGGLYCDRIVSRHTV